MMTALVLYCYCKGIRSSRAVQMACFDDVGCRVITGNQAVDHATAARFVRRHRDALTGLFVQVLAVCAREGLVTVDLVAGDGTKVKASASKEARPEGAGGRAGRPPRPMDQGAKVGAARAEEERAAAALQRALADPNKGNVPKGNTTDPHCRIMPAKAGGYMCARNLQALANDR